MSFKMTGPYESSHEISKRINSLNEIFFHQTITIAVPALVLITGLTIRAVLSQSKLDELQQHPLFSESNVVNQILAEHGISFFTALFLLTSLVRLLILLRNMSLQPLLPLTRHSTTRSSSISKTRQLVFLLADVFVNYSMTVCLLWLLLSIRTAVVTTHETLNISGHFIVITTFTITLVSEVRLWPLGFKEWEIEEGPVGVKHSVTLYSMNTVLFCDFIGVILWWVVQLVTSVFYHTAIEKIIGLALGYLSPLTVYYLKCVAIDSYYKTL